MKTGVKTSKNPLLHEDSGCPVSLFPPVGAKEATDKRRHIECLNNVNSLSVGFG